MCQVVRQALLEPTKTSRCLGQINDWTFNIGIVQLQSWHCNWCHQRLDLLFPPAEATTSCNYGCWRGECVVITQRWRAESGDGTRGSQTLTHARRRACKASWHQSCSCGWLRAPPWAPRWGAPGQGSLTPPAGRRGAPRCAGSPRTAPAATARSAPPATSPSWQCSGPAASACCVSAKKRNNHRNQIIQCSFSGLFLLFVASFHRKCCFGITVPVRKCFFSTSAQMLMCVRPFLTSASFHLLLTLVLSLARGKEIHQGSLAFMEISFATNLFCSDHDNLAILFLEG